MHAWNYAACCAHNDDSGNDDRVAATAAPDNKYAFSGEMCVSPPTRPVDPHTNTLKLAPKRGNSKMNTGMNVGCTLLFTTLTSSRKLASSAGAEGLSCSSDIAIASGGWREVPSLFL